MDRVWQGIATAKIIYSPWTVILLTRQLHDITHWTGFNLTQTYSCMCLLQTLGVFESFWEATLCSTTKFRQKIPAIALQGLCQRKATLHHKLHAYHALLI